MSWSVSAKEIEQKDDSETVILKDDGDNMVFKRRFDLIATIGTHQFAYTNYLLIEPDESTHLQLTTEQLLENSVQVNSGTTQ